MTEELVVLNLDESVQSKFEMQFSSSAHYSKSQIFVQKFQFIIWAILDRRRRRFVNDVNNYPEKLQKIYEVDDIQTLWFTIWKMRNLEVQIYQ